MRWDSGHITREAETVLTPTHSPPPLSEPLRFTASPHCSPSPGLPRNANVLCPPGRVTASQEVEGVKLHRDLNKNLPNKTENIKDKKV